MQENTHKDTKSWTVIFITIIILALLITMTGILISRRIDNPEKTPTAESSLLYDENTIIDVKNQPG